MTNLIGQQITNSLMSVIGIIICVMILGWLAFRQLKLWYWRTNEQVNLLYEIRNLLYEINNKNKKPEIDNQAIKQ